MTRTQKLVDKCQLINDPNVDKLLGVLDSYKQRSKKLQDALEKQQFESNLLKLQLQSLRNESVVQKDLLAFTEQRELKRQFSRMDDLTLS